MNKKIKKILKILKKCYELKDENFSNYISLYQLGILLDYITNLEKYTDEIFLYSYEELQDKVINLQKENKELNRMCELYSKSLYNANLTKAERRIDKAIDYIKAGKTFENKIQEKIISKLQNDLLNILKGDDKQ